MDDIERLMANLTDEQVADYQTAKYPESIRNWAKQESAARIARREQAQAELANKIAAEQARAERDKAIEKIIKGLEKVWDDEITNILITREEVDDLENGEEVEVTKLNQNGESEKVTETRYPKVKKIKVRTNIYWSTESKKPLQTRPSTASKRAITVRQVVGNEIKLIGNFRTGQEASDYLDLVPDKGSANSRLIRNGYVYTPYDGNDFTVTES